MLDRFIFAPITIAVAALTAAAFSEDDSTRVPLKKFTFSAPEKLAQAAPEAGPIGAEKNTDGVPWNKPEKWEGAPPPPAQPAIPAAEQKPPAPDAAPPEPKTEKAPIETEPGVARAVLVTKREITAQLQIFLDQQLFSPGMIDGKPGKTLTRLFKRWQKSRGLPETGVIDENVPLDSVYPIYTFHKVAKQDFKTIGSLPGKTAEQAKRKFLPYSGYLEFVSERYHASPDFIQKLNPGMKFDRLKPGDELRVPNVAPFKIEEMPDTGNLPDREEFANRRIVITRSETVLDLYEGEKLIAAIPIAPGSPAHPTPKGNWRIVGIASMPTFRWDAGVLSRGVRTSNFYMLPAGPNNPVGVAWIGLNKAGIGIHGTNNPHSIGTFASHGCMRTANWDVSRIAHLITKGVPVEIR